MFTSTKYSEISILKYRLKTDVRCIQTQWHLLQQQNSLHEIPFIQITNEFNSPTFHIYLFFYSNREPILWHKPFVVSVLSKLLTSLSEADNKLSGESELHFLQTLLQSKEINALVNVHHMVAKVGKDDRIAPILSASMQVAIEILELLAPRCHFSPLCKELFHLLQKPHLQVSFNWWRLEVKEELMVKSILEFNVRSWCRCTERLLSTSTRDSTRNGRRRGNYQNCSTS